MRGLLSSGWTVLALLLTGTYLLGFAGSAMAEEYPSAGDGEIVPGKVCQLVGTPGNPACCTVYTSTSCVDTINDPGMDGCRPYRWVRYHHHRPYGTCAGQSGNCTQYPQFPCAKLKIWRYLEDCTAQNSNWVWANISLADTCMP